MIPLPRSVLIALLWVFSSVMVPAQTAPDIARGTTSEEVIRIYGWPNGKSTAQEREVWLYDDFQVAFEKGRVLNVWSVPEDKRQPKRRQTLPVDARNPPPLRSPTPSPVSTQPAPRPLTAPSIQPARPVMSDEVPTLPERTARKRAPRNGLPFTDLLPWVAVGCAAVIGIVIVAERRRIAREVQEMTRHSSVPPPVPKPTWQESVAASVARVSTPMASHLSANPTARDPNVPSAAVKPVVASPSSPDLTELTYELLDRMEWKRLEMIVALYFGETGVRAECTCIGPDGGVDIQLYRPGERTPFSYVQCKAMSWKVDVKLVRELFGVMASAKITEGVFVTTGRYTREALSFAAMNNIKAISGLEFVDRFNALPRDARQRVLSKVTEGDYTTPTCSRCDIKMILRETEPPQWGCRCGNRQYIRKTRWSALRAAKR